MTFFTNILQVCRKLVVLVHCCTISLKANNLDVITEVNTKFKSIYPLKATTGGSMEMKTLTIIDSHKYL